MSEKPRWDRVVEPWSGAAAERIERDAALLRRAVMWRVRRRMAARLALGIVPLVALVWCVMLFVPKPQPGGVGPVAAEFVPAPASEAGAVLVTFVATDTRAAERAVMAPARFERIGDEELRAALREAGVDPGLVRVGERVLLAGELEQGAGSSGS